MSTLQTVIQTSESSAEPVTCFLFVVPFCGTKCFMRDQSWLSQTIVKSALCTTGLIQV